MVLGQRGVPSVGAGAVVVPFAQTLADQIAALNPEPAVADEFGNDGGDEA